MRRDVNAGIATAASTTAVETVAIVADPNKANFGARMPLLELKKRFGEDVNFVYPTPIVTQAPTTVANACVLRGDDINPSLLSPIFGNCGPRGMHCDIEIDTASVTPAPTVVARDTAIKTITLSPTFGFLRPYGLELSGCRSFGCLSDYAALHAQTGGSKTALQPASTTTNTSK